MQRQRIIHVLLKDLKFFDAPTTGAEEMSQLATNGERFWASTSGHQTISKLFRVSAEARQAALLFYRVRFPCWLRAVGGVLKPGILYFNPEHDFLQITPEWSVRNTLFNFMHLLKTTYDPLHIGIRNLVVCGNDMRANDLQILDPSDLDLDGGIRESYIDFLENLHEVFFISGIPAGRAILGFHSGVASGIIYNRSFPIKTKIPTFDRLQCDPRSIGEDLKEVFIGTHDNRNSIRLWRTILEKWGTSTTNSIYPSNQMRRNVFLTSKTRGHSCAKKIMHGMGSKTLTTPRFWT